MYSFAQKKSNIWLIGALSLIFRLFLKVKIMNVIMKNNDHFLRRRRVSTLDLRWILFYLSAYCHILNLICCLVGKLLVVDVEELAKALTTEMVVTRGESIVRAHTVCEACNLRDSLAKALYGRLFDWIVNKMNQTLSIPTSSRYN
jgi:hypothetical protein